MTETIGPKPLHRDFEIYHGADLVIPVRKSVAYPTGARLTLVFKSRTAPHEFEAVLTEPDLFVFNIDRLEINALVAAKVSSAKIYYDDGTGYQTILLLGAVTCVR